jgi:hypothetical protein
MTTNPTPHRQPATGWVRLTARPSAGPSLARERAGGYDTGGEAGSSEDVRDVARELRQVAERLVDLAAAEGRAEGGELGALQSTLWALDAAQAAAVELTSHVQRRGSAERSAGLSLEHLLALETRLTGPDRRMLASAAETLRTMPHLTAAFQAGRVGWAEVRSIVCEARRLPVKDRAKLDHGFGELCNITVRDPDRLLDEVRAAAAALRPDRANKDTARHIEHRFLALQPQLGGSGGTGYFELDGEDFATVVAGLEAAMPAPSAGPNDVTTDAVGHADDDTDETETADGDPAFCDHVPHRVRARQRADALVLLAESFLAGTRADGEPRRARPRILIGCELHDLVGDVTSMTARLLTAVPGLRPAVTREALRRLASDADLQLVIKDRGQIVGVTAPTATIPARVRAAVAARDQGCRFPGCRMPIQFTDCHHVKPREDEGPTVISNLVALCRRHHTAVTEGRWKLTMTEDGTVTVRRGRRVATSDPPCVTPFRQAPRQPAGPTTAEPPAGPEPPDPDPDPGPPDRPPGSDPPG